jgi:hypothetical protein
MERKQYVVDPFLFFENLQILRQGRVGVNVTQADLPLVQIVIDQLDFVNP